MSDPRRTKDEWLAQFDDWFKKPGLVYKYTNPNDKASLIKYRELNNTTRLMNVLNNIWFYTPGHIFNVHNNPEGWKEFLELIEFWDEEEISQICK